MLSKILKHIQKYLNLEDWNGKIKIDSCSCVVFDKRLKQFIIYIAWFHLLQPCVTILHELLHIKYPEKSEEEIEDLAWVLYWSWLKEVLKCVRIVNIGKKK